ncbi:MAG: helix-turn-helix transcriptional regulator [Oceanicaulis sp.]|nr:helix-turn-helix transcriptional regulator [Oceanicaulis sp.]
MSQTLNGHLGTTFFDYVARWRVQAAQPLLLAQEASVLTIALEVGFNSRSTFYKAFKRETGLTPKDYQKQNAQALNPAVTHITSSACNFRMLAHGLGMNSVFSSGVQAFQAATARLDAAAAWSTAFAHRPSLPRLPKRFSS